MDASRRLELQSSLQRGLNAHAMEHGLGSAGRVGWLLDQFENYVDRWLGIGAFRGHTLAPSSDDLFRMIEIGAEVISQELERVESAAVKRSWQAFLEVLAEVQAGSLAPQRLTDSLAIVRHELDTRA